MQKYLCGKQTNATTYIITFNIDKSREELKMLPLINTKTLLAPINNSYKITLDVV